MLLYLLFSDNAQFQSGNYTILITIDITILITIDNTILVTIEDLIRHRGTALFCFELFSVTLCIEGRPSENLLYTALLITYSL